MKRKEYYIYLLIMMVIIAVFSGCSKKNASTTESISRHSASQAADTTASKPDVNGEEVNVEAPEEGGTPENADITTEKSLTSTSAVTSGKTLINSKDKIIRNAVLDVETQEFDNLMSSVDNQIKTLGGYVESSNINGNNYYSDNLKYANIVARIPKEQYDGFINKVYDIANVVNKQETTENVTLQYVDTQSHIKALKVEQDRLLELLEKVETLDDIITLETQLSSVRYELETYESQLITYDNLVDYCTVTLNIQEVERITPLEGDKKTAWNRIKTGFGNNVYNIGEGLKNFVVWFFINLPYLIIWAAIITVGILIGKRINNKSKSKNNIKPQVPSSDKVTEDNESD